MFLAAATLSDRSRACSVVYPSIKVGRAFRVVVSDRGRPVAGLLLTVATKQAFTDKEGIALFRNVPPGSFFLSPDRDNGIVSGAYLKVTPDGPADVTVAVKWPAVDPIVVRSLNGRLRLPGYLPELSQREFSVELLEAVSGRSLKMVDTRNGGEFHFGDIAPGLYFLALRSAPLSGLIAVFNDPNAQASDLDLELGSSSCGLYFTDRNKCRLPELRLEELCGEVVDSAGGAIAADIYLSEGGQNPAHVERIRSDSTGGFAWADSAAATYDLLVTSPGFTPLRTKVHLQPGPATTCRRQLRIQLGILGACSSITLQ